MKKKEKEPHKKIQELQRKIHKALEEKEEYLKGWRKERAQFANYKKDEDKRVQKVIDFANENLLREFILVLDSFDLALQNLPPEKKLKGQDQYLEGIYLIRSQILNILKKAGLREIKAADEIFDPAYHEIVGEEEDKKVPPQSIIKVLSKGYALHNKVIRPARVIIAKNK